MFGSKERREREEREAQAARLEREARAEDRRATQHTQWAVDEMRDGRPGHSRMWASKGHANTQEADRLRREAARIRRG